MSGSEARLSRRELERLAVLRVIALAEPESAKVAVWRADLVALLDAVDRLSQSPSQSVRVESVMLVQAPTNPMLIAGTATTVNQYLRPPSEEGRR